MRTPVRRVHGAAIIAIVVALVGGCGGDPQVLADEAFRNVVPANAQLDDEVVDDGSSLIEGGEQAVLRTFSPVPPAQPEDVLMALVEEGERDGWVFSERSPVLAVGTKEIDGRPWMVSLAVDQGTVRQFFAGR